MHEKRKEDHIRINLEEDVGFPTLSTGLERYRFCHNALPELNLADIETQTPLFGKTLQLPLLIASMTGGTEYAELINLRLAEAAEARGVAIGVGSQRAALEDPGLVRTFQIRPVAPSTLIFANLGAVQLNYGYGVDHCRRAVEMIAADALILHFNPLQEAVQPEGNTNFAGLYARVEAVCRALPVPVIAKEVGWGFSEGNVRRLVECGVAAIDVAGSGGTSWSQVEMYRATSLAHRRVAATFADWGRPTAEAVLAAKRGAGNRPVFASGGLRTGLDIARCIGLGAYLGSVAGPFLKAAVNSVEAIVELIDILHAELKIAMFAAGIPSVAELKDSPLLERV